MKHILLLFHHYRTPQQLGGLRSWHIGTHLRKAGYRVTAIAPGVDTLTGQKHPGLANKLWHKETIDGVNVVRINSTDNNRSSKISRILYYLSFSILQAIATLRTRQVDEIVVTSMPLTSVLFAYVAAKLKRVPLVLDIRDLTLDTAVDLSYFSDNILIKGLMAAEEFVFKQADHLITVSQGMADIVTKKGVDPAKMTVVPIGYEGDVYRDAIDWHRDIRAEYDIAGKFIVLYAGSMGHVYDVATILATAALTQSNPNIVYLFVGGGQRLEEYQQMAADQRLNCIFAGQRPKLDVPLFCTQANIGLYPLQEGQAVSALLGNKIFDYLGNGLPVIYSGPQGDVSRLIQQSQGGRCVGPKDYETIASLIAHFYQQPQALQAMSTAASSYVQSHLSIHQMMSRFEGVVSSALTADGESFSISSNG